MALRNLMSRLATVSAGIMEKQGTNSFFVLREQKTPNGKGGTLKVYNPTTAAALPCFYSVLPASPTGLEAQFATQKRPVVYRRFVCKASVDVKGDDKLRLVAHDNVPETDMQILRVNPLSGLMLEIITVSEVPLVA